MVIWLELVKELRVVQVESLKAREIDVVNGVNEQRIVAVTACLLGTNRVDPVPRSLRISPAGQLDWQWTERQMHDSPVATRLLPAH